MDNIIEVQGNESTRKQKRNKGDSLMGTQCSIHFESTSNTGYKDGQRKPRIKNVNRNVADYESFKEGEKCRTTEPTRANDTSEMELGATTTFEQSTSPATTSRDPVTVFRDEVLKEEAEHVKEFHLQQIDRLSETSIASSSVSGAASCGFPILSSETSTVNHSNAVETDSQQWTDEKQKNATRQLRTARPPASDTSSQSHYHQRIREKQEAVAQGFSRSHVEAVAALVQKSTTEINRSGTATKTQSQDARQQDNNSRVPPAVDKVLFQRKPAQTVNLSFSDPVNRASAVKRGSNLSRIKLATGKNAVVALKTHARRMTGIVGAVPMKPSLRVEGSTAVTTENIYSQRIHAKQEMTSGSRRQMNAPISDSNNATPNNTTSPVLSIVVNHQQQLKNTIRSTRPHNARTAAANLEGHPPPRNASPTPLLSSTTAIHQYDERWIPRTASSRINNAGESTTTTMPILQSDFSMTVEEAKEEILDEQANEINGNNSTLSRVNDPFSFTNAEDRNQSFLLNADLVDEDMIRQEARNAMRQEAMALAAEDWNREITRRTVTADKVTILVVEDEEESKPSFSRRPGRKRIMLACFATCAVLVAGILVAIWLRNSEGKPLAASHATDAPITTRPLMAPFHPLTNAPQSIPPETLSPLFVVTNNTKCVDALPISTRPGFNTYRSMVENAMQVQESYQISCPDDFLREGNSDISGHWYKFTANSYASVTIVLCVNYLGSPFGHLDAYLYLRDCSQLLCAAAPVSNVYTWYDPIYNALLYCTNYESELIAGAEYKVLVNATTPVEGGFEGKYTLSLMTANDHCTDAKMLLTNTRNVHGSTTGASPDVDMPMCDDNGSHNLSRKTPGIWYYMIGDGSGVRIDSCGSTFPTRLSVFESDVGTFCTQLRCVQNIISNKSVCDGYEAIAWVTEINRIYYILFHGDETNITLPDDLQKVSGNFVYSTTSFDGSIMCDGARSVHMDELLSMGDSSVWGQYPDSAVLPWSTDMASRLMCGGLENPVPVETPGIWYTFEGFGAQISLTTCADGTNADTKISVFKGSCSNLTCVTANDNSTASECQNYPGGSLADFFAEIGATYFVFVHGSSAVGGFALALRIVSCSSIMGPYIADGQVWQSTTRGAMERNMSACGGLNNERSVVFAFYGTGTRMTASTCHSSTNVETKLSIMTNSCCDSIWFCYASDVSSSPSCSISWDSSPGKVYYVVVNDHWSNATSLDSSNFSLSVTSEIGDSCVSAAGPFEYPFSLSATTTGSTIDANTPTCGGLNHTAPGVWYTFDGTGGPLAVEVCPSESIPMTTTVYTGDCNASKCIATRSNSTCGPENALVWSTTESQIYRVLIAGIRSNTVGPFTLSSHAGPAGLTCEEAQLIPISYFSRGTSLVGSTVTSVDYLDTRCGYSLVNGPGVWFKIEGLSGALNLNTCASTASFEIMLNVFTSCDLQSCVTKYYHGFNGTCGHERNLTFVATANTTYYVVVGGSYDAGVGDFVLNTNLISDEKTDGMFCESALGIGIDDVVTGSISDRNFRVLACAPYRHSVWYKMTGVEGQINVNTCTNTSMLTQTVDSDVFVLSGTCENLQCVDTVRVGAVTSTGTNLCGSVDFNASAFETYYIAVSQNDFAQIIYGDFVLVTRSL